MSTTHPITADELLREGSRIHCELIEGEVVEMSPAGIEHAIVSGRLMRELSAFVHSRRLGETLIAEGGFLVARDPDTVRVPDVAFLSNESIRRHGIPRGYFPGPPDLAVEVVSPNDRQGDVDAKIAMWLSVGTRLVWVIYPGRRLAEVHQAGCSVELIREDSALPGRDVLPELMISLLDVFVA